MDLEQLKKDLKIKEQWVFKEYNLNGKIYETKRFNLWFQIFREKETKINKQHLETMYIKTQKEMINKIKENIYN